MAFVPKMEMYRRDSTEYVLDVMFPGYVLVKTEMNQFELDEFLLHLYEQNIGVIKELKRDDVSCLTEKN